MTPSEIFARADDVLQDTSFVRWPQAERLRYLNDGRREMAVIRPDIYATTDVVTLVAGTKQALPAGRSRLFDVVRNINSDSSPGPAVRIVEREVLDSFRPGEEKCIYLFDCASREDMEREAQRLYLLGCLKLLAGCPGVPTTWPPLACCGMPPNPPC